MSSAHQTGLIQDPAPPRSALRSRCSSHHAPPNHPDSTSPPRHANLPDVDHPIAASSSPPVPLLPCPSAPSSDALLHALAIYEFDPTALAEHLSISPFALLNWYESDEIQAQLERYHAFERRMLELRSFESRRLTIESLEHVLETTEDLIEKRRTATTLHRVISGVARRSPGGTDQGGTDLRDVRAPSNRSTSTPNHPSTRSATPAEPRSASDGKQHRVSDHGTPEPPTSSPSSDASVLVSVSEPGSASDHGDDKQADPPAEAAKPPFRGSANAEPPSVSESDRTSASKSEANLASEQPTEPMHASAPTLPSREATPFDREGRKARKPNANQAKLKRAQLGATPSAPADESAHSNNTPEIDWDAFTAWTKPSGETERALRKSTSAPRPVPHQRE